MSRLQEVFLNSHMKVSADKFLHTVLLLYFLYYFSLISFISGFLGGKVGKNTVEEAASGNIINQIFGLLLLLLTVSSFFFSRRLSVRKLIYQNKILLVFIIFCVFSFWWSVSPFVSIRRFIAFSTLILSSYLICQVFSTRSLLNFLLNFIFAVTVIGIVYTLLSGKGLSFGFSSRELGLSGIFLDKNAAARFYGYGVILLVALKRYAAMRDVLILVTLLISLLLSQSVSALGMTLIGCSLVIGLNIFRGRNATESILRLMVFIVLNIVVIVAIKYAYEYLLSLLGRDPGLTNRGIIWELLQPFIDDKPNLGYGFAAFWAGDAATVFINRWGFIGNAHSGYYEILLNLGLVGLCLKILFIGHFFKLAIDCFIKNNLYASFFLSIVIVQAVINYAGFVIFNHNSLDMVLFFLTYFLTIKELNKNGKKQ
jgi:exopolysaccharide production protein ExoQ